jgi:Zn-dependent metalloprotease
MTTRYAALIVFALVGALAPPAQAQSLSRQRALDYLQRNAGRHGLSQADVTDLVVTDETTSRRSGVAHVYVRQQIGGVPVVAGAMTVNVAPDGRVLLASGELVPGLALRAPRGGASVSPAQAAEALAADIGLAPTEAFVTVAQKEVGTPGVFLSDGGVSREPVAAALVYAADASGALRLAYEVQIAERAAPHVWLGTVDAASGQVLRRVDLVIHDAFAGDDPAAVAVPAVTTAPLVLAPARPTALAPMFPVEQERTVMGGAAYRVYAAPVAAPIYTTPLPPADARTLASGIEDTDASPYGWHDTNGVAGAEFTITRGNNTHSYTDTNDDDAPDAGGSPDGTATLQFDFPLNLAEAPATYRPAAVTNLFYWTNLLHDVYYQYGFDEAAGNFQQNQYGRGGAATNDAVLAEAQDGGGTENANFYTPIDGGCGALGCFPRMQMYLGDTATPDVDGDLDNHVIAHEYTHGLSKRLTGGPTTECLQNSEQMGEGWSDWYGLMVTMDADDTRADRRTVGNYLFGQPVSGAGIRPAPYSTSFTINNFTYQRTRTAVAPHGVGFIWSTILWEATWDMIAAHGFSPDVYNAAGTAGNQMMLNLVTEALKMQPCSPGFVDGRDAILAADEALYNGDHVELLYAAFARRGLGLGASQGSSGSNADNTESFIEPEEIAPTAVTNLTVAPNGDYVTLRFTATGDDGSVGTAATYRVRRASTPILTDAAFDAATPVPVTAAPAVAGTPEAIAAAGLAYSTTYCFALKVADESLNVSPLSNSVCTTTLAAPTATVPSAPISVVTPTTATATLTLSNAGPSDLRFSLALEETTARPAPATPTGPAAPAVEREKGFGEAVGAPQLRGSGGPDAFGYRWTDSNEPGGPVYAFTDISATGTPVTLSDDSASPAIPLPFAFSFYGVDYSTVFISSNGHLTFGTASTDFSNDPVPTAATPNNFVAGYWDDLNPGAGGQVDYQTMADGSFVVQYTAVPRYGGTTGTVTMQVILSASGAITYQYQSVPTTNNSATIGIENATGTDGLQIAFNAAYAQASLAVRIAALFVETDVTAGLIPAGQSQAIQLLFDATGLAPGTYTANLTVTTNSTNAPTTVIPVTLTVGAVSADAGPLSFEGTHLLGAVYPNPAPGAARMDLAVAEAQTVRVELYDALGRRVGVVFDGPVAARTNVPLAVSSGSLAAGTYVLRVVGETFSDARRLTVVR